MIDNDNYTQIGITKIMFGNGRVKIPEMRHFTALFWAKEMAKQYNTWFTYTLID